MNRLEDLMLNGIDNEINSLLDKIRGTEAESILLDDELKVKISNNLPLYDESYIDPRYFTLCPLEKRKQVRHFSNYAGSKVKVNQNNLSNLATFNKSNDVTETNTPSLFSNTENMVNNNLLFENNLDAEDSTRLEYFNQPLKDNLEDIQSHVELNSNTDSFSWDFNDIIEDKNLEEICNIDLERSLRLNLARNMFPDVDLHDTQTFNNPTIFSIINSTSKDIKSINMNQMYLGSGAAIGMYQSAQKIGPGVSYNTYGVKYPEDAEYLEANEARMKIPVDNLTLIDDENIVALIENFAMKSSDIIEFLNNVKKSETDIKTQENPLPTKTSTKNDTLSLPMLLYIISSLNNTNNIIGFTSLFSFLTKANILYVIIVPYSIKLHYSIEDMETYPTFKNLMILSTYEAMQLSFNFLCSPPLGLITRSYMEKILKGKNGAHNRKTPTFIQKIPRPDLYISNPLTKKISEGPYKDLLLKDTIVMNSSLRFDLGNSKFDINIYRDKTYDSPGVGIGKGFGTSVFYYIKTTDKFSYITYGSGNSIYSNTDVNVYVESIIDMEKYTESRARSVNDGLDNFTVIKDNSVAGGKSNSNLHLWKSSVATREFERTFENYALIKPDKIIIHPVETDIVDNKFLEEKKQQGTLYETDPVDTEGDNNKLKAKNNMDKAKRTDDSDFDLAENSPFEPDNSKPMIECLLNFYNTTEESQVNEIQMNNVGIFGKDERETLCKLDTLYETFKGDRSLEISRLNSQATNFTPFFEIITGPIVENAYRMAVEVQKNEGQEDQVTSIVQMFDVENIYYRRLKHLNSIDFILSILSIERTMFRYDQYLHNFDNIEEEGKLDTRLISIQEIVRNLSDIPSNDGSYNVIFDVLANDMYKKHFKQQELCRYFTQMKYRPFNYVINGERVILPNIIPTKTSHSAQGVMPAFNNNLLEPRTVLGPTASYILNDSIMILLYLTSYPYKQNVHKDIEALEISDITYLFSCSNMIDGIRLSNRRVYERLLSSKYAYPLDDDFIRSEIRNANNWEILKKDVATNSKTSVNSTEGQVKTISLTKRDTEILHCNGEETYSNNYIFPQNILERNFGPFPTKNIAKKKKRITPRKKRTETQDNKNENVEKKEESTTGSPVPVVNYE